MLRNQPPLNLVAWNSNSFLLTIVWLDGQSFLFVLGRQCNCRELAQCLEDPSLQGNSVPFPMLGKRNYIVVVFFWALIILFSQTTISRCATQSSSLMQCAPKWVSPSETGGKNLKKQLIGFYFTKCQRSTIGIIWWLLTCYGHNGRCSNQ